jgi:hypothetical protein
VEVQQHKAGVSDQVAIVRSLDRNSAGDMDVIGFE